MNEVNLPFSLSGNKLKLIAALSMFIDHFGMIFFPKVKILRIIGRLAFPIFAYMIAEGARHTRSRARYFLSLLISGIVMQAVYFAFSGSDYLNIFLTFSLSLAVIWPLHSAKNAVLTEGYPKSLAFSKVILAFAVVLGAYFLCLTFTFSYGFTGVMTPVFASLFMSFERGKDSIKKQYKPHVHLLSMSIPLVYMAFDHGGVQFFALAVLPLLFLYSGKRGEKNLKYFFYLFYPLHLVLLEGVYLIIK